MAEPVANVIEVGDKIHVNFWIMNGCVCLMVLLSACFAEFFIRGRAKDVTKIQHSVIYVPDSVFGTERTISPSLQSNSGEENKKRRYILYIIYNICYFLLMMYSVVTMKKYPLIMVGIQHVAVMFIVTIFILQFTRPTLAIPLSVIFALVWLFSMDTSFRWITNNTIVLMCIMLTGYVQFKNFAYLQIFMWLAFIYDVYLLAGFKFIGGGAELFSFDNDFTPTPTAAVAKDSCGNLLCSLFSHYHSYELPTVFSIQIGDESSFIFIGTGDIIIGAFVANFSLFYFKARKYLFIAVFAFGTSVAALSQVTETPFPALLSIVPLCTMGLLFCAVISGRSVEMLLGLSCNDMQRTILPKHVADLRI